jgi:death-on-curing protein
LPSEPDWLGAETLIALNAALVAETGEPHFVRDPGLLESALAKPINHWHYGEQEMSVLAVSLLLGIARNHPFGQGNKRTALEAADAFLWLNGYDFVARDGAELADLIVAVITGEAGEEKLVELFGTCMTAR